MAVLPERIPLVLGIWIEPGSDPGHAAHLDPVSTLLEQLQRDFPATPFRLLVPPLVARATWLRQVATKAGTPVTLTTEVDPAARPVETLVRHSHVILCLAPGQEQSQDTIDLIRWKREGRIEATEGQSEAITGGPVEFWDLSRGGRARRQHLGATLANASFREFARHVRAFNRRTCHLVPTLHESTERERSALLPENSPVRLTPGQTATLERAAVNAAMAARLRPIARATRIAWSALAVSTGIALLIAAQTSGTSHQVALDGAVAFLILAIATRLLHARWLRLSIHHRALAETMRIHFVRCVAGLTPLHPDNVPKSESPVPRWLSSAIDSWTSGLAQTEPVSAATVDRIRLVQENWVSAQRDRLAARAVEATKSREFFRNLARGAWIVTALLGCGLAGRATLWITGLPELPFAAGTAVAAVLASLFQQASSRLGQEAQRCRREQRTFTAAAETLARANAPTDLPAATRIIDALATEALAENADWVVTEKERGLTPAFR